MNSARAQEYSAAAATRSTLPECVVGNDDATNTDFGRLGPDNCSRTKSCTADSLTLPPIATHTRWPQVSSGNPKATT